MVQCVLPSSAGHYFWYTLLSPSWGMWRSAPESTGHEAVAQHFALLLPNCQLLLTVIIQNKSLLQPLANTSNILPSSANYSTGQTAAPVGPHTKVMTCLFALCSRQCPPWQQLHCSVALILMITAVTKLQAHSRLKKCFGTTGLLDIKM